jgi:hypothetical protein
MVTQREKSEKSLQAASSKNVRSVRDTDTGLFQCTARVSQAKQLASLKDRDKK